MNGVLSFLIKPAQTVGGETNLVHLLKLILSNLLDEQIDQIGEVLDVMLSQSIAPYQIVMMPVMYLDKDLGVIHFTIKGQGTPEMLEYGIEKKQFVENQKLVFA